MTGLPNGEAGVVVLQGSSAASGTVFEKIQGLIKKGVDEGAEVVCGGPGKPRGHEKGYYVKPTVFGNVRNNMTIAREEIFGPVLCILPYQTEAEAIAMANDTPYGLSGYVQSSDVDHAVRVASQLRTGNVHINGAGPDFAAPFGQSGVGGRSLRSIVRDRAGGGRRGEFAGRVRGSGAVATTLLLELVRRVDDANRLDSHWRLVVRGRSRRRGSGIRTIVFRSRRRGRLAAGG
jgi:aldehyde dehydrogenase family protein